MFVRSLIHRGRITAAVRSAHGVSHRALCSVTRAAVAAAVPATNTSVAAGATARVNGASSASAFVRRALGGVRRIGTAGPAPSPAAAAAAATQLHQQKAEVQNYFGANVFDRRAMKASLAPAVYAAYSEAVAQGKSIDLKTADAIAAALLAWAQARGATHYTHWFQPLNGVTAEKHDTFLDIKSTADGETAITRFRGKDLIMGEPDGSSFPSGGLRSTHVARGYTAWDPTSHPFVLPHGNGSTLYIPACFFSWKDNQALDDKTVLLRSGDALRKAALNLFDVLGDTAQTSIHTDSGIEQEFFLINREYYLRRPDLMVAGRTLVGAPPPKGQELEDQYFGHKATRFIDCIHAFELQMWKLGVPIMTRHREVAPGQYEVAPRFTASNVATDRNLLMMEVLRSVARSHGLAALLHEKPFKGVNGSGKHNNWSFGTNKIPSVLDPGPAPEKNAQFMLFLSAVIRAVDVHSDLLRWAIAGAGNDHRLGANEAPPAIISAYLGDDVAAAVESFVNRDPTFPKINVTVDLGVSNLPPLARATTDRNRTSPFAFTGNKFEFRAVGASQSPSRSNMVLNTILAESLNVLANEIRAATKGGRSVADAVEEVARANLAKHKRVIFNGNGYSPEWAAEAARRGLLNLKTTPDALALFNSPKNQELFGSTGVLSKSELDARYSVYHTEYCHKIGVEAKVMVDLAMNSVVPAATEYQHTLASTIQATSAALALASGGGAGATRSQSALLSTITANVNALIAETEQLESHLHEAESLDAVEQARFHLNNSVPAMQRIREASDLLETLLPAKAWPLPTYHEMLFHQD